MILVVLLFAGNLFMQGEPVPVPVPGQGSGSVKLTVAQLPDAVAYGDYLYSTNGEVVTKLATGGADVTNQIWSLPDWIASSRKPENTVDQPDAAQLNDGLVQMVAGLVLVAMFLIVAYYTASTLRGEIPNPLVAAGLISSVAFAALVAVNNRWLQHFPIDLVNLILATISGTPIKQFVQPVFHLVPMADALWAAIMFLAVVIVTLMLTVILFIEGAWCIVLGALAGLAAFGMVVPFFGGGCQFLLRRWMGSLFSPVLVFAALRLASPTTAGIIDAGAPQLGVQLLVIAFLIVAWQAPGLMVGAIAVSFPGVAQAYFAGRLLGIGRFSERMIPPGGGGSRSNPPRSRQNPPTRAVSSQGMGSGAAARSKPMPRTAPQPA